MARRLWPTSRKYRLLLILAIVIAIVVIAILYTRRDRLPSFKEMGIEYRTKISAPVLDNGEWHAGKVDAEGFAQVADNGQFTLLIEPKSSQIAVVDKKTGYLWRSNPSKEQLSGETVKGALLENLQSPFIMEHVVEGQIRRTMLNTLTKDMTVAYTLIDKVGIQATYTFKKQQLSFAIQYKITSSGLEVGIPSEGIRETGDNWIYSINLLPYFGAVPSKSESGYLFVPDGPGGLIYYDRVRPKVSSSYEFPIYGDDPAQTNYDEDMSVIREQIAYPVFGLKRGNQAFAAIVKEGPYTAKIKAAIPGTNSNYHSISVNFNYREEYGRKVSGLTQESVKSIRKARSQEDHLVEYRLLSGDQSDYVGMAHSYREYLASSDQLGQQLKATDHMPLMLSIVGGGNKPQFGRNSYETATTFKQAEEMVDGLLEAGVAHINVTFQGWQNSGHTYTDERFPIVSSIGGVAGAKDFVQSMHDKGIKVMLDDYMAWKSASQSSFYKKTDGIRGIDSTSVSGQGGSFIVNTMKAVREQKGVIDTLKKIGIDGIHYVDGPGNVTFSDYNPKASLTRSDTVYYYQQLLDYVQQQLGSVGITRGEQYSLKHVDYIEGFPYSSSQDLMIDETVPFYPIAVHGTVAYTTVPGNMRDIYEDEFLKAIEYGAVPFFKLTYSESRVLKRTDFQSIYSSQYAIWKDRIVEEYKKFDQLATVYHQNITKHEKLGEKIYATTYEDGTKVTVNYNTKQFSVEGGAKR
ncbi:DUF5696 domain-containing protein [Cohnella abietis]|uniref:Uncharacterized protein n=1 Tax=Cohnella abietis TaxID=2507935 RepID=A0A3T1D0S3_9BACL|nr:DUF5696 domain-containing protein [Cohnella abietis]BBI31605.1 hypothetical protein KCTCHS21_10040 [Cohnella abietis]